MKVFMDNVPTLVIQAGILRNLDQAFCPSAVYKMNEDTVAAIAGESEAASAERKITLAQLGTLQAGARICRQYALKSEKSEQ
jgi:hypothetical protein